MKEEKAITLVSLIITVVLMLIIITVTYNVGNNLTQSVELQEIYTQVDIIQASLANIIQDTNEDKLNEYKINENEDKFVEYTPKELEKNFDITGITQNAWINWKTRQVYMLYNNEQIYSIANYVENEETNTEKTIDFNIEVTRQDDRYHIKITPNDNQTNYDIAYKKNGATNWVLINKYEFDLVEEGDYEFKINDKFGNEATKLQTVAYIQDKIKNDLILWYDGINKYR